MGHYQYLFLDADNTLFDFDRSEFDALTEMFASRGYVMTNELKKTFDSVNKPLWKAFDRGECTRDWLSAERFRLFQIAVDGTVRFDPKEMHRDYQLALSVRPYLLPGADQVCRSLAENHKIYILTNGFSVAQRRVLASAVSDCFSGVYISEDMGCQKPEQKYYKKVFSDIGLGDCDKVNCLAVGDNPVSDISGAGIFGLTTVWLKRRPDKELPEGIAPDYTIKNITQLPDLVAQLEERL